MENDNLSIASEEYNPDFSKDENLQRGNWGGKFEFLLSALGFAVGLGNVWRFPYLAYTNGGGVFLIPYFVMLFLVGMPVFFLEICIGQFSSCGPFVCWECVPIARGIGFAMVFTSYVISMYYNVIIAWALFYMGVSMNNELPWKRCRSYYASDYCVDEYNDFKVFDDPNEGRQYCQSEGGYIDEGECRKDEQFTDPVTQEQRFYRVIAIADKEVASGYGHAAHSASADYLFNYALGVGLSEGFTDLGPIRWRLALAFLAAWIIVGACLIRSVKSSGKVVYFTATFPYIILTAIVIRGVTLPGSGEGLKFYLKPDFSKLGDIQVWRNAAAQIFFSLSNTLGGLTALASYNRFHHNILQDGVLVPILNCMTSFYAGFAVFSVVGFLAHELGQEVDQVVDSGVTLAFVVYPTAVARMPGSVFWSAIFFFMLVLLGIDSQFNLTEAVITSVLDVYPNMRSTKLKQASVTIIICVIQFFMGLVMVTNGGVYVLDVLDYYINHWTQLFVGFSEIMVITYVYGISRFLNDIAIMMGRQSFIFAWKTWSMYWKVLWTVVAPVILALLVFLTFYEYEHSSVEGDEAEIVGLTEQAIVAVLIFGTAIILTIYYIKVKKWSAKDCVSPTKFWGPALPKHRKLMLHYLPPEQVDLDPRRSQADALAGEAEAVEITPPADQAAGEEASPGQVDAKVPEQAAPPPDTGGSSDPAAA